MKKRYSNIIRIILAALLLSCLFHWPYDYYLLVRFLAMTGFGILAVDTHRTGNMSLTVVFVALVLLFQPYLKMAFGRTIWHVVDVLVALFLILSAIFSRRFTR